ncbi:hypothetical protein AG1IA_01993 [Rhizoctonia solani AG-1 IA]|uniref:Uncharacterized protein n=1 Tax=Thanatephorus cucumeris (strain AG1-IA) TaxID=983506 RepID=L8X4E0_THACA|nr:hypothetical protein AG1IA_01993 [Rhizoctonia solani AG-1 IA]
MESAGSLGSRMTNELLTETALGYGSESLTESDEPEGYRGESAEEAVGTLLTGWPGHCGMQSRACRGEGQGGRS